jgi:hypothetical protein
MKVTGFILAMLDILRREGVFYVWQGRLTEEFRTAVDVQAFCNEAHLRWACAYPRYPELHIFML